MPRFSLIKYFLFTIIHCSEHNVLHEISILVSALDIKNGTIYCFSYHISIFLFLLLRSFSRILVFVSVSGVTEVLPPQKYLTKEHIESIINRGRQISFSFRNISRIVFKCTIQRFPLINVWTCNTPSSIKCYEYICIRQLNSRYTLFQSSEASLLPNN